MFYAYKKFLGVKYSTFLNPRNKPVRTLSSLRTAQVPLNNGEPPFLRTKHSQILAYPLFGSFRRVCLGIPAYIRVSCLHARGSYFHHLSAIFVDHETITKFNCRWGETGDALTATRSYNMCIMMTLK